MCSYPFVFPSLAKMSLTKQTIGNIVVKGEKCRKPVSVPFGRMFSTL